MRGGLDQGLPAVLQGQSNFTASRPVHLVGLRPVAEYGSTYILTMIDRTICWLEAVSLRSMEVATCADAFINT